MVAAANTDSSGTGYTLHAQVTVVVWAIVSREYLVPFMSKQSNPLTAVSATSEDVEPLCSPINGALENRIVFPPAADRAAPVHHRPCRIIKILKSVKGVTRSGYCQRHPEPLLVRAAALCKTTLILPTAHIMPKFKPLK